MPGTMRSPQSLASATCPQEAYSLVGKLESLSSIAPPTHRHHTILSATRPPVPTAGPLNPPCQPDTTMTNAGLLIKDSSELVPAGEAAVLVPNLTWGAQLIVSIILTVLDSRYLSALHSSLPHPPTCTQPPSVTSVWKAWRRRWGEEAGIRLPVDQGWVSGVARGRRQLLKQPRGVLPPLPLRIRGARVTGPSSAALLSAHAVAVFGVCTRSSLLLVGFL